MITTQITRIRNADASETLSKHSDGSTLQYSEANPATLKIEDRNFPLCFFVLFYSLGS